MLLLLLSFFFAEKESVFSFRYRIRQLRYLVIVICDRDLKCS